MSAQRILVVDDEANARRAIATILGEEGYEVAEAANGEEALARLAEFSPAVVLTDVRMPKMDGLTFLQKAREQGADATFIVMTAFASVETAVEAMRAGAENYLVKPLDANAVLVVLGKALEKRALKRETENLREQVRQRARFHNIIGDSSQLQAVYDMVKRAATTKATVLILGESGTGKELIAQAIHHESQRRDKPFVKVHCAALSEGLLESELFGHEKGAFTGAVGRKEGRFELADGGTLFLDEIGEISPSVQVKLLRVLQQREFERVGGTQTLKVDVRIVAATNRDLVKMVAEGKFREDLYYRIKVVELVLPPLRERGGEDIERLTRHFIAASAKRHRLPMPRLSPSALERLKRYRWPGNVRELENCIESAVVLSEGEILEEHLPLPSAERVAAPSGAGEAVAPG
ncbi:MAG TPA: sigma-54 dependent transcriptional regulator, partial [Archangium sp.]